MAKARGLLIVSIELPWVATLVGVAALIFVYRYERNQKKHTRALFFADCLDLLQSYRVTQDGVAYPVLVGRYRHYEIRMEPVIDHMAWRKLPLLWLKVTLFTDISYRGVIDLLMRPMVRRISRPATTSTMMSKFRKAGRRRAFFAPIYRTECRRWRF